MTRRHFNGILGMSLGSGLFTSKISAFVSQQVGFKMCLNPGAIGVRMNQSEAIEAAHRFGFDAVIGYASEMGKKDEQALMQTRDLMQKYKLHWGAATLPIDFRKSETIFNEGMDMFPQQCQALKILGITRMNTWIMPTHQELSYLSNFDLHKKRLSQIVSVLEDYGIRLGLEYVGPKTLMTRSKYPFIHTMNECLELISAIDSPDHLGLVLDSFHWFCAQDTAEDILNLSKEQIVTVDLNDAVAGRTADEQIDWERELPTKSGVIDLATFLRALETIGYQGPVRAEPFNKLLNEMNDTDAIESTKEAMSAAFALLSD